jgi:hypothetical protein
MSQLLVEVPDQKKEEVKVLVEVDEVPCESTDKACNRRWLESQSDCV